MNIAVEDARNFNGDVCSVEHLYCEYTTFEGRILFECQGVIQDSGFDMLDCALVDLRLNVRKGMARDSPRIYHAALPMRFISSQLLAPPFEWKGWVSLLPQGMCLDACADMMMFAQTAHCMQVPDSPRLLLRIQCRNPELQAQLIAVSEHRTQELRAREQAEVSRGKQLFKEVHAFLPTLYTGTDTTACSPVGFFQEMHVSRRREEVSSLEESLRGALGCLRDMRDILADQRAGGGGCDGGRDSSGGSGGVAVPPALDMSDLLTSPAPEALLADYGQQLSRCVGAFAEAAASRPCHRSVPSANAVEALPPFLVKEPAFALAECLEAATPKLACPAGWPVKCAGVASCGPRLAPDLKLLRRQRACRAGA